MVACVNLEKDLFNRLGELDADARCLIYTVNCYERKKE
jgi:hypothetical protein